MQASLQFTPDQKQDLLHLRRLFLAKVGQLARQRQALLERIANSEGNLPGSSGRVTQSEDAAQLRQNGIEECQIHLQFVGAMVDGVTFSCCNKSSHAAFASQATTLKRLVISANLLPDTFSMPSLSACREWLRYKWDISHGRHAYQNALLRDNKSTQCTVSYWQA